MWCSFYFNDPNCSVSTQSSCCEYYPLLLCSFILCACSFLSALVRFIIFGIGLDDAFVIKKAIDRTNHLKEPTERVADMLHDIGMSITLTTITSTVAFSLGALSTIPFIQWLCLYAFPTIIIVYLYQLTFFTACVVLDEQRINDRRRDCCFCISAKNYLEPEGSGTVEGPEAHPMDRLMQCYAEQLLVPRVKVFVVIAFGVLLGTAIWSASMIDQEFKLTSVLPADS